jgi:hypothetical protein
MVNGKKFPYTGKGMMDAAIAKKKSMPNSRPDTGGSAQLKRDLKTNKSMNNGKGPLYEAGSKEELARQARKTALQKFGKKSKQYKRTMPSVPDSIIKRKGM